MTLPGRRAVGRARRRLLDAVARLDPTPRLLGSPAPPAATALVCVYRAAGVDPVRALLAALPGVTACLWSLDGAVPDDLAPLTVGSGAGTRFVLLNRLVAQVPEQARAGCLVLADDDVRFAVGTLPQLLEAGRRLHLDLWQPAQMATSHSSWPITRRRLLVLGRYVDFVEQGPLVVLSSAAQAALLPLPEDLDMGWGIEVRWSRQAGAAGLRMGIVDAVGVCHLHPAGAGYDRPAQEAVLAAELARAGLSDMREMHATGRRVRPWHRAGGAAAGR